MRLWSDLKSFPRDPFYQFNVFPAEIPCPMCENRRHNLSSSTSLRRERQHQQAQLKLRNSYSCRNILTWLNEGTPVRCFAPQPCSAIDFRLDDRKFFSCLRVAAEVSSLSEKSASRDPLNPLFSILYEWCRSCSALRRQHCVPLW